MSFILDLLLPSYAQDKMKFLVLPVALSTLYTSLTTAHSHAEAADTQEPFVGWTQEDLDAKWGTDVRCLTTV